MADSPIHTLILAARAEGGDELADAAEVQLRGLMERDAEAQVAALREASGGWSQVLLAYVGRVDGGGTWHVTFWPHDHRQSEVRVERPTLPSAIAAVRAAAHPARAQAAE